MTRLLLILAGIAFFALLIGRAVDQQHALTVPPAQAADARETYQGRTIHWWAKRAVQARRDANKRGQTIRRLRRELSTRTIGPTLAIRLVFGAYAEQALRVAWCESRWHTGAQNGQYLGLFQMGEYARSRYGHSADPLGQARAAYAYFVDSGRDWSPLAVPTVIAYALISWGSFVAGYLAHDIYRTVFVTTRRGTVDLTHLSREKR